MPDTAGYGPRLATVNLPTHGDVKLRLVRRRTLPAFRRVQGYCLRVHVCLWNCRLSDRGILNSLSGNQVGYEWLSHEIRPPPQKNKNKNKNKNEKKDKKNPLTSINTEIFLFVGSFISCMQRSWNEKQQIKGRLARTNQAFFFFFFSIGAHLHSVRETFINRKVEGLDVVANEVLEGLQIKI